MTTTEAAQTISCRYIRQVWVVESEHHVIRFHYFYRPTMGKLVAIVIGENTLTMEQ